MDEREPHLVKITFDPVTAAEMELLLEADERLNERLSDRQTAEYDGFERGQQDFVMYFYGSDADRMLPLIIENLRDIPYPAPILALKSYGDSDRPDERVEFRLDSKHS